MRLLKFAFAFMLAGALFSCEKEFEVDQKLSSPKITINCNYDPWFPFRVYATQSFSLTGAHDIKALPNALVQLFENDSFLTNLTYYPYDTSQYHGYYACSNIAKPGKKYSIKVTDSQLGQATAEDQMPIGAAITSSQLVHYPYTQGDVEGPHVRLSIKDVPGIDNYYRFNTYFYGKWHSVSASGDTTYSDQFFGARVMDLSGAADTLRENGWTLYFTDRDFKNGTGTIDIHTAAMDPTGFDQLIMFVDLHTVSENMYRYFSTLQYQRNAGNSNSTQPVFVYSNVKNGYGVFAGLDVTQVQLVVK